jgi:hypothetical protein
VTWQRNPDHEPEVNTHTYIRALLDFNANKFLREDMPRLYASIVSDIEAGKMKAEILERCAAIKGMNEYVINSIKMTINHLERMKNHKKEYDWGSAPVRKHAKS